MADEYALDVIAFVWFVLCASGYGFATRRGPLARRGLNAAIQEQRMAWMRSMALRDNRIVDIQLLTNLSNGNAFFASTSVIVVGGLAAALGAADRIHALLDPLPMIAKSSPELWHMKILFLMGLFVIAFFKFAWGFRLSHYTAIMIGATPIDVSANKEECLAHARHTAQLAGIAATHANAGIRMYYFAIAAAGWFLHPLFFMVTTLWVVLILYRREYRSRAWRIIRGDS